MYKSSKTRRTLFTEEKIRNLHKNIREFSWAAEKAADILKSAQVYLDYGTDRLAAFVTSPVLKRSASVNQSGCPFCGAQMMRYGDYGWIIDYHAHPWKVKCPHCNALFPSNDFESFYQSGLDSHGEFSYERADRSLLVNTLYPEQGPGFAVDDGTGWLAEPSDPARGNYAFIAYYILHGIWIYREKGVYENCLTAAIRTLAQAYLITGDQKYGYPAAMLLNKFAWMYPKMDVRTCRVKDGFRLSHGGREMGRILGCIWDTLLMNQFVEWYDILYDCMDDGFAAYLRENPLRYFGSAPQYGTDVIANIEQNTLLQIYPDYRAYMLLCNPGPPQALLLKTAKVLQREDLFQEYADFLFHYIDPIEQSSRRTDMASLFLSHIDRDGFAGESAVGYNGMWASGFMEAAELLQGHDYDLFNHVKFRKMGNMPHNYAVCDRYTLHVGDSGKAGDPSVYCPANLLVKYFLQTQNSEIASFLVSVSADAPICTDWFLDCKTVDQKIRQTAAAYAPSSKSRCLSGYGLAVIESHPEGKDPEANTVYFGSNKVHGHCDTLHLNVYGFGIDMMPDFGYPDFASANANRSRWTSNMLSHNTVTIPQEEPFTNTKEGTFSSICNIIRCGQIRHFSATQNVSLIDAEAPAVYNVPFHRICITVDLDGKSRYLVDLFEAGGKEQHISYHAIGTQTHCSGLQLVAQKSGSYAGEDVPYEDSAYSMRFCDGFNYLKDVSRCQNPERGFTVDWKCEDNWHVWTHPRNVHLKLHMLSGVDEAAICTGQPPKTKPGNPDSMTYLIAKKSDPANRFVSVIEPYEDTAFLSQAHCTAYRNNTVHLINVTHLTGRTDYVVINESSSAFSFCVKDMSFTVSGHLSVLSFAPDGTLSYRYDYGVQRITGHVTSFTKELCCDNYITVHLDCPADSNALCGKYINIQTSTAPNAFFEIKSAHLLPDGNWKLGIGDVSLATGFIDREHQELGYTYCICEDAAFCITF